MTNIFQWNISQRKDRAVLFSGIFFTTTIIFLIDLLFGLSGDTQKSIIFSHGQNFLADFFNHILYVRDFDPYFNSTGSIADHCFPPLCYLIFHGFTGLVKNPPTLEALQHDLTAVGTALSLFLIVATGFISLLGKLSHWNRRHDAMVTLMMLFSGGLIFTIERGNFILITVLFVTCYLILKEKKSAAAKTIAAFCLAAASATKVYPCIFGILWLNRRDMKWLLLACVLTLFLGFAPLFCFQHSILENSLKLYEIASQQSRLYFDMCPPNLTFPSYVNAASHVLSINLDILTTALIVLNKCLAILCLAYSFIVSERWKKYFLVAAGLVLLAHQINWYAILYFYPAIFLYLTDSASFTRKDWIYIISFCFMLTPLQFGTMPAGLSSINAAICSFLLYVVPLTIILTQHKESQNVNPGQHDAIKH